MTLPLNKKYRPMGAMPASELQRTRVWMIAINRDQIQNLKRQTLHLQSELPVGVRVRLVVIQTIQERHRYLIVLRIRNRTESDIPRDCRGLSDGGVRGIRT